MEVVMRERKSRFVKLFDKTPPGVRCPHFYELVLSNGCPYDCAYCYLRLTFRGNKRPVLFTNRWEDVRRELDKTPSGWFSTGELADSLAVCPPLLGEALDYFANQDSRYMVLTTKSVNIRPLINRKADPQTVISFSINSVRIARQIERFAPPPEARLQAAQRLMELGWRVRIRLDPVIIDADFSDYKQICRTIANLRPERVTVGTLRQYPGLHRFAAEAPKQGLTRAKDGRLRYPLSERVEIYERIAEWLGFQPALCKETDELMDKLGWEFYGCNCTP